MKRKRKRKKKKKKKKKKKNKTKTSEKKMKKQTLTEKPQACCYFLCFFSFSLLACRVKYLLDAQTMPRRGPTARRRPPPRPGNQWQTELSRFQALVICARNSKKKKTTFAGAAAFIHSFIHSSARVRGCRHGAVGARIRHGERGARVARAVGQDVQR